MTQSLIPVFTLFINYFFLYEIILCHTETAFSFNLPVFHDFIVASMEFFCINTMIVTLMDV